VCARCYAAADIVETDKRAAHNIRNTAIGCAAGGIFSFFSPLSGFMIVVVAVIVATFVSGIYAINSLATRGHWNPLIGRTLPLSEAAAAHRLQEENTLQKKGTLAGKIVLVP
jgi:hypothetical protein